MNHPISAINAVCSTSCTWFDWPAAVLPHGLDALDGLI